HLLAVQPPDAPDIEAPRRARREAQLERQILIRRHVLRRQQWHEESERRIAVIEEVGCAASLYERSLRRDVDPKDAELQRMLSPGGISTPERHVEDSRQRIPILGRKGTGEEVAVVQELTAEEGHAPSSCDCHVREVTRIRNLH